MGLATLTVTDVVYVSAEGPTDDTRGSDDREIDDELDALVGLGDEIATLAAHLHAATYRLLTMIAEFDRLRGWEAGGGRPPIVRPLARLPYRDRSGRGP